jgi:hypothetical protein
MVVSNNALCGLSTGPRRVPFQQWRINETLSLSPVRRRCSVYPLENCGRCAVVPFNKCDTREQLEKWQQRGIPRIPAY